MRGFILPVRRGTATGCIQTAAPCVDRHVIPLMTPAMRSLLLFPLLVRPTAVALWPDDAGRRAP